MTLFRHVALLAAFAIPATALADASFWPGERPAASGRPAAAEPAAPTASAVEPPPEAASAPRQPPALMRELTALIESRQVNEMRTTYNGPFAAALFFEPENLNYYVALLKGQDFWWIGRTTDAKEAETLYTRMAAQTVTLAAPDLEKMQLDARIAATRRQLEQARRRQGELAEQLQAQRQVIREGVAAQARLQSETRQLAEERARLQQQLQSISATIDALEAAANKVPNLGAVPGASEPAAEPARSRQRPARQPSR